MSISPKKTPMPEQAPQERIHNFLEVPLGYTEEMAIAEAGRCLQCKKPLCRTGCPVSVKIPEFIALVKEGEFARASRKIRETNCLPAVCGRVCPQEKQCESQCILGKKNEPVAIGRLERFVADYERIHHLTQIPPKATSKGKRIAVIGAGPSGLTVAGDLALLGYEVTIFEAFHRPGGVLMYGIPEFRLPKAIVETEVDYLRGLGVVVELNQAVGTSVTVDEILSGTPHRPKFDAVYIGVGAGLPSFMGIPGEELGGVYSANEYLTRSNLMRAYRFPEYDTPILPGKNVAVVGGGNVAMDAARTAKRLGAENVYVLYRRSMDELPARGEEVHHAMEEGVHFRFLAAPVEYLGDKDGRLNAARCQEMELGEPDASGRRRPVPKRNPDGSMVEFTIDIDLAIVAIGGNANPILAKATPGLELNRRGYIQTYTESGRTSRVGVWAGGDIVTGAATVILAMGAGKSAAADIDRWLSGETGPSWKA
ncbi:MAG: NADPH-dependent glutamate synthase [Planctomycetia bacterium]|nr:NADPH-dependent glutamate synthase [Planctomycetia bacterium]